MVNTPIPICVYVNTVCVYFQKCAPLKKNINTINPKHNNKPEINPK